MKRPKYRRASDPEVLRRPAQLNVVKGRSSDEGVRFANTFRVRPARLNLGWRSSASGPADDPGVDE